MRSEREGRGREDDDRDDDTRPTLGAAAEVHIQRCPIASSQAHVKQHNTHQNKIALVQTKCSKTMPKALKCH